METASTLPTSEGGEQQMSMSTVNSNGPLNLCEYGICFRRGPSNSMSLNWVFSGFETEMEARLCSQKEAFGIFSHKIPNAPTTGGNLSTDFTDSPSII